MGENKTYEIIYKNEEGDVREVYHIKDDKKKKMILF